MAFPGSVTADLETNNTAGTGDFADDPAIFFDPLNSANNVIITANKDYTSGGLYVQNLTDGNLVESEDVGQAFNNVDLRYGFGTFDNIVAASGRESGDVHLYTYDPAQTTDELDQVGTIATGYTTEPYGLTMGRLGDAQYVFVSADNGTQVKQYELSESAGVVSGTLVRTLNFSGQVEGMVTDDVKGFFYAAEEDGRIKKFGTDPASGSSYVEIDKTAALGGNLTADIEGLAIYYGGTDGEAGYLIASAQGESTYAVYDRTNSDAYLGEFSMSGDGSTIDAVTVTDGLDVTNVNLGGLFDEGMFVAHDGTNTGGTTSNFKMVEFDEIANLGGLTLDTSFDPRAAVTAPTPSAPTPPPFFTINTTDANTGTFTGTSGNDTLTGTSAPELFDGLGGDDTYHGGTGDDQYRIAQAGDVIASDTGGQDSVELFYTGNYTMSSNMEHVIVQGSTNRTVTGNADNNIMTAAGTTSGTMTFIGGTGDDNIRVGTRDVAATGGADNDLFRYSTNAATGTGNTIADFTWGDDLIDASPLVTGSYAPTVNPFTNGVLSLVDSGSDVKLMWDQDGSSNSTVAAVEVVTLLGVQIDAGINEAHIYTGL